MSFMQKAMVLSALVWGGQSALAFNSGAQNFAGQAQFNASMAGNGAQQGNGQVRIENFDANVMCDTGGPNQSRLRAPSSNENDPRGGRQNHENQD